MQSNDDFFDIQGVINIDWVPEGQTVNQIYYKNVLTNLRERVTKTRHVEECLMDSSQRASTKRAICEEVFGEKPSSDGTSTVQSGPSTVRLFPLPENQVCTQRNQV